MKITRYEQCHQQLAQSFVCGNIIIDNFLKSSDALDENQGITYILLSDNEDIIIGYYLLRDCEKRILNLRNAVGISFITLYSTNEGYHLYHNRNSYSTFENDMSTFVPESDKSCYKLYKCIDDIVI